ncbi:hypothetical protein BGZ61DRAFT_517264 [Ilyonectria robusta]|uniref:uncharacterized protein n=1 Tax=Ilyonectria robusta TaxID=1079257 RepID=UPI001E8D5975|nr:uncharacterized protein BGZ61DRAFT_517264 [Ilyonectria robusta]KAH8706650.1 hypothetical protein BGZ61DRAFT_517264 [Ilyonectria robusta]
MPFPHTPTLPAGHFKENIPHIPVSGLITPPDSPIEEFIPRCEKKHADSSIHVAASGPSIVIECGTAYPVSQIRVMATELECARDNGEFPSTTASAMDTQAVIEDYGRLMRLRQSRGNQSLPAPESYKQLRVEIARRIKDRDASQEDTKTDAEAARRVSSYLRSVQQEQRYFDAANTMLQRRGVSNPTQLDLDNVSEELCSIVEQTIEQTISDATGPLRLNVGNLHNENADFRDQNNALGRQIDMHYRVLEQQTRTNSALLSMFEPQSKNITLTTENIQASERQLAIATKNSQAMEEQLTVAAGLTNVLSQVVMNLPGAINQVVYTAVQHQTQDSFKDILEAQQKVILDLETRSRKIQALAREVEASRIQMAGRGQDLGARSQRLGRKSKGKMRNMVNRVFGSQR